MTIAEVTPGTNATAAEGVHAYARSVVARETVANRYVRLACERHLRELEFGAERGLRFDPERAGRAIRFFGFLRLAEGAFEGLPFVLTPSQVFKTGSLFGWLGPDGLRRFRNAYVEEAKGNGKSPWGAGICLYGMVADGEAAAEILSAAAGRSQATIPWTDARRMVEKSPALSSRIGIFAHALVFGDSSFRPVSSEAKNLHGPRVHIGLIDEEHAHPNSDVVDAMRAGTKGRRQALILRITNSGYDRQSICWQDHEYSVKVLEGALDDDAWFAFVCGLDPCDACRAGGKSSPTEGCADCDDWRDERVWPKANPNLGVSVTAKYLRELVTEAIGKPASQNIVKRLNFCIWTEGASRAIALEVWDRNGAPPDKTAGREAFGGLDLASTSDIAALMLLLPAADGTYDVLGHYFIPEANVGQRVRRDGVPYDVWIRDGFVTATPGDITDYGFIRATAHELAERYRIIEIAYDRWNASQLVVDLGADGLTMTNFGQSSSPEMAAAVKEFERLVIAGRLRTGGDPVLRWMASNLAWRQDAAGNLFPDRRASADKIDGIVGLLMAIGRALTAPPQEPPFRSNYETTGLTFSGR